MELEIRRRTGWMRWLGFAAFFLLVYAYAQLNWSVPQGASAVRGAQAERGSILAEDGTVLAQTVGGVRHYPQGVLAGQLLGMLGTDRGLEGLEYAYDEYLAAGNDLTLTLDPALQNVAEEVLAKAVQERQAVYGTVVALETRTGKVLALANYPGFDPNRWQEYPAAQRRNRAILDIFEPGSTVKALVIGAALNEGVTTPAARHEVPMSRRYGAHRVNDSVAHEPVLRTWEILRYSSNVGMSQLGDALGSERVRAYLAAYGLGERPELGPLFSQTGTLKPIERWGDLVRTTNTFGQGVSANALQLAAAFNTVANGGVYTPPRIVVGAQQAPSRQVLRPETARDMQAMLRQVLEEGLPRQAGIPGYSLAGKTGTSQIAENGRYSPGRYDAVFSGFFPAEDPRVTISVFVHDPKDLFHGSQTAAPVYRDIAAELIGMWGLPPAEE